MSKTIFEAYNYCKKQLEKAGVEDFAAESRAIIRHLTGYANAQILTKYNEHLTPFQENNLIALIHQREVRYPLQYIFGQWNFYGREFEVGPGVLIPRSDTETLIDTVLELIKETEAPEILDLCAGSGCIGITLAAEKSDASVTLVEKYEEAMRYLNNNASKLAAENTKIVKGDIFEATAADGKYDIIVSNPPYISEEEMATLQPEVKFEPETALKAEENGLEFYRAITDKYRSSLKADGKLCFEVGYTQADAVSDIMRQAGFKDITVKTDMNGKQRVVFGTVNSL